MEAWQKGATVVKKMSKGGQSAYFKKFPEREDWFKKNHPDMPRFDKSVKQASMTGVSSAVTTAREKASLKAYGATKGTKVGEIGGERASADKDTTVPLTPEQHSKVQAAKRSTVKGAALSHSERISAIARASRKAQTKHDVPTEDPDDAGHDDLRDVHNSLHVKSGHYSESSDYSKRRKSEEDIISGKKKPKTPSKSAVNDYFKRRKAEKVNEGAGYGIGSVVKLHKPIDGHEYGHVMGITGSKVARGPTGRGTPMPAGKASSIQIQLKKTPNYTADYGAKVEVPMSAIHSKIREEVEQVNELSPATLKSYQDKVGKSFRMGYTNPKKRPELKGIKGFFRAQKKLDAAKANEEAINELSPATLTSYQNKVGANFRKGYTDPTKRPEKKGIKGYFLAAKKLKKTETPVKESSELDESPYMVAPVTPRTTDIEAGIKAYKGSMSPVGSRLYGKVLGRLSKKYGWSEKDLHDHIAHEAGVKEEVEQVNELSRDLLKRYSKAAKLDADKIFDKPKYRTKYATGTHIDPKSGYSERNLADRVPLSKKDDIRTDKREVGQEIAKQKLSRVSQQVKVKADNQPTLSAKRQASFKFEEVEQVTEGRPSQQHPLEGHPYHKKSNDELEYIAKDAHKAAEAMKSHNTTAENKYRDQASDSATVRHFRKTSGMPSWYKKKYSLGEEAVNERLSKNNPPAEWIKDFVASDNPKFSGKSKKERITMALGAYYSQKRKG